MFAELDTSQKLTLRRERLNAGGYDDRGSYWGVGQPLFWLSDEAGNSFYFRASNRAEAKAAVQAERPEARFYR